MPELWLEFENEGGEQKRVKVDRTPFTVGRHSECDLSILDGRLSREHLRIEQHAEGFVATDLGSSNGTLLDGQPLAESTGLRNDSVLDLGGVQMRVILENVASATEASPGPQAAAIPEVTEPDPNLSAGSTAGSSPPARAVVPSAAPSGIPTAFFFVAPLLAVFVLAAVIGAVVLFGGGEKPIARSNFEDQDITEDDSPANTRVKDDDDDPPKPNRSATPLGSDSPPANSSIPPPTPGTGEPGSLPAGDTERAKVERNGAVFIRQIAQNDPRAFLTGEQAAKIAVKVKQVGRSSVLADNIGSARKNAAAIKTLAEQKNLKPQFLAVAALTRLGNSRGDALQAAQGVAEVYDQLRIQIGNENFDDALLMVAAFDQGAAGETMKMRNMLQDLATKSSEGTRTIRSIWFLEKAGKISSTEYDRALSFLAIGTIAQNPKEFGVNAEALKL